MTPELQKQLAEMLARLTDATTGAATWAQAQAGPLVQEKITFGRLDETVQLLLAIAAAVALIGLSRWCVRILRSDGYHDEVGYAIGGAMSAIGGGIACIAVCVQLHEAMLVWFAPRLYVVEWLKAMVTK